jgi:hypothetical protein
MITSDAAATHVPPGVTATGAPGVDDATLDRITGNLLSALAGIANPEAANPAALEAARISSVQILTPANYAAPAVQTAIAEVATAPITSVPVIDAAPTSWTPPLSDAIQIHDRSHACSVRPPSQEGCLTAIGRTTF